MGKFDGDAQAARGQSQSGRPASPLIDVSELATARLPAAGAAVTKRTGGPPPPQQQLAPAYSPHLPPRDAANLHAVREQARRLSLALFFREQSQVRSLGFTSAIGGEGKSFMALMTASVLARDSAEPVILVEANWEHPTLHTQLGLPQAPGLAEWMRQECDEADACHQIAENLGVIPAGNERGDAVRLLRRLRDRSVVDMISSKRARYIFDLPPIVTCSYGRLAAGVVESVIVVVQAGITPEGMVAEACAQLKDLPVEGIFLNQVSSHIPQWLQRIL